MVLKCIVGLFWGRIFNMAANSLPKIVPQCTLTTISTRSPAQPQSGESGHGRSNVTQRYPPDNAVTIQCISMREVNCVIQWIEISSVDCVIHLLNNQGVGSVVQQVRSTDTNDLRSACLCYAFYPTNFPKKKLRELNFGSSIYFDELLIYSCSDHVVNSVSTNSWFACVYRSACSMHCKCFAIVTTFLKVLLHLVRYSIDTERLLSLILIRELKQLG